MTDKPWTCPHGPRCPICTSVDQWIANGNLRVRSLRPATRRESQSELARAPFGADTASRHEASALRGSPDEAPHVGPTPSRLGAKAAAG